MKEFIQTSGFVVIAILPILLISRWRHWGLLASVLLGWGILHLCNLSFPITDHTEGVFTGLWAGRRVALYVGLVVANLRYCVACIMDQTKEAKGNESKITLVFQFN